MFPRGRTWSSLHHLCLIHWSAPNVILPNLIARKAGTAHRLLGECLLLRLCPSHRWGQASGDKTVSVSLHIKFLLPKILSLLAFLRNFYLAVLLIFENYFSPEAFSDIFRQLIAAPFPTFFSALFYIMSIINKSFSLLNIQSMAVSALKHYIYPHLMHP